MQPDQLTWAWTAVILLKGWLAEAAAVVVTGLMKGPLFRFAASYALGRVQQTSMMWKHDFTLKSGGETRGIQITWRGHNYSISKNVRKSELTGCYVENRAGAALSQMGGWALRQEQSSLLHRSTASSSAGPQTPGGLPSLLASHYLPNSSSSSPEIQTLV